MAKLENYTGSIELISGLKQKNDQDFPLMDAHSIQTNETGKRLDEHLTEFISVNRQGSVTVPITGDSIAFNSFT